MAYNKDTQTITSPVTMRDVQQALGTSVNTLSGLCTSPNINMWSKKKPVRLNRMFTAGVADWWKGDDGKCGFEITSSTNPADLVNAKGWTYTPPSGGIYSPYRLLDFDGYCGKIGGEPVISLGRNAQDVSINMDTNPILYFTLEFSRDREDPYLAMCDFNAFGDMYLGVIVFAKGNLIKPVCYITSNEQIKMADTIIPIDFSKSPFSAQDYVLIPCITRYQCLQERWDTPPANNVFISVYKDNVYKDRITAFVVKSRGAQFNITKISDTINGQFLEIDRFYDSDYFRTPYVGVALKGTITSDKNETINVSDLRINCFSIHGTSETITPIIYDANKNKLSVLKLTNGIPLEIYIDTNRILFRKNGEFIAPMKGEHGEANMTVNLPTSVLAIFNYITI